MKPLASLQSLAAAAVLSLLSSADAQTTYDLQAELSGAQPTPPNPSGNFSYGRYLGGVNPTTFELYSTFNEDIASGLDAFYTPFPDPNVLFNDTGSPQSVAGFTMQPNEVSLGPAGGPSVVRFTAPLAGDYDIGTEFLRIQSGNTDAQAFVFHNTTQLGTGVSGFSGFTFIGTESLAAGDTVDFVLAGSNAGFGNATSRLTATLVVPEPTSVALLGSSALALLVSRRKRA